MDHDSHLPGFVYHVGYQTPADSQVAWNASENYPWAYIGYITALVLAAAANTFMAPFLLWNYRLKHLYMSKLMRLCVAGDLVWGWGCLVICSMNASRLNIFAGGTAGCYIQAWLVTYCMVVIGYTHTLISYCSRRVLEKRKLGFPTVVRYFGYINCYGTVLTFLAVIWPGEPTLVGSGSYCMAFVYRPIPAVMFVGLGLGPAIAIMALNYYKIWRLVQRLGLNFVSISCCCKKKGRGEDGDPESAQQSQLVAAHQHVRALKRMAIYPLVFLACWSPVCVLVVVQWITGSMAPAIDAVLGIGAHFSGFLTPVAFVWANKWWRAAIGEWLAHPLRGCGGGRRRRAGGKKYSKSHNIASPRVSPSRSKPGAAGGGGGSSAWGDASSGAPVTRLTGVSELGELRELQYVLNTPALRRQYTEFLVSEYCVENLLFFDRVNGLHDLQHGDAILAEVDGIREEFMLDSSEWQVNLPHRVRQQALDAVASEAWRLEPNTVVYDKCQRVIRRQMQQDSFARFQSELRQSGVVLDAAATQQSGLVLSPTSDCLSAAAAITSTAPAAEAMRRNHHGSSSTPFAATPSSNLITPAFVVAHTPQPAGATAAAPGAAQAETTTLPTRLPGSTAATLSG